MNEVLAPVPSPALLPLNALHRRLGARLEPYLGSLAPAVYTTVAEEYQALRQGCGLVDRSWTGRLELTGPDRARFLNGLVTCEVKTLAPGAGRYGFVTQVKGRILSDLVLLALDDRFWLELAAGTTETIAEHLRKYLIADRVEIQPLDALLPFTLAGPQAAATLKADLPQEPWQHVAIELFGSPVRAVCEPGLGVPAWTLWLPAASAATWVEALLAAGTVRLVGHQAYETLRIVAGRPLGGRDFGPDCFPQETGLADTVSYTKGCYLGQEVVARIHYRGGVNRLLRGLVFSPGAADPTGQEVLAEGRAAGVVTSAVASPADGRYLGLAILHQRAALGSQVELADGGVAEVVELPFSPSLA